MVKQAKGGAWRETSEMLERRRDEDVDEKMEMLALMEPPLLPVSECTTHTRLYPDEEKNKSLLASF